MAFSEARGLADRLSLVCVDWPADGRLVAGLVGGLAHRVLIWVIWIRVNGPRCGRARSSSISFNWNRFNVFPLHVNLFYGRTRNYVICIPNLYYEYIRYLGTYQSRRLNILSTQTGELEKHDSGMSSDVTPRS